MSTPKNHLPMPGAVAVQPMQARRQSPFGDMVFTHRPDPALRPRRFTFAWRNTHGAVADAIRRHYEDHAAATFTATLPRTGAVVYVRWLSPPSIQWNSSVSASVTAEFEEALAHE